LARKSKLYEDFLITESPAREAEGGSGEPKALASGVL
jgi:hypothetical protein